MKDFAKGFYNGVAWIRCRDAFISKRRAIDGGLCQRCGKRLGYIVHHRIELTPQNIGNPEITFSHNNLEYLCHECHNAEHGVFIPAGAGVSFDENGDVVAVETRSPQ